MKFLTNIIEWYEQRPIYFKPEELYQFSVNLELMLASGIGISRALEVLAGADEPAFREVCGKVSRDIASGHSLSSALTLQPKSFPNSFCRLIQTGEMTGKVTECLARVAATHQQELKLKRILKKAITYPAVLLVASSMMIFLVLFYVFPMIINVTMEAGVDPPAITLFVQKVASKKTLGVMVGLLAFTFLAYKIAFSRPTWSRQVRYFFETYTPVGRFYARSQVVMALRQLALMLECGTDMVRSLRMTGKVGEGSFLVGVAFRDLEKRIKEGELLSTGFAAHKVFPRSLSAMAEVAEELGETHGIIYHFCDIAEDDIQTRVSAMSAAFEPILMGVMGFIIGTILLAAFLPVYQLVNL